MDRTCYPCHVTGYGHPEGPTTPDTIGGLHDVQCETCHGPSAAHVANPTGVKPVLDPGESLCVTCHDGVRDEGRFDYSSYRAKIVHDDEG